MTDAVNPGNPGSRAVLAQDWFTIRELRPTDTGRIAADWSRSLQRDAPRGTWPRLLAREEYGQAVDAVIDAALRNGEALIAADTQALDHVLGWLVHGNGALHYAYVKAPMRRRGVFTALYAASGLGKGIAVTALTYQGRKLGKRYGWRYVPAFNIGG